MQTPVPPAQSSPSQAPLRPDADSEVDLRSGWAIVLRYWWLIPLGAALAVAAALASSSSAPTRYEANATVYIGQPVSPSGVLLNTVSAKASTAIELAQSDGAVQAAADVADQPAGEIRSGLSVTSVQSPIASKLLSPPTMIKVTVRNENQRAATAAAAEIAAFLIKETSAFSEAKSKALDRRVEAYRTAVEELTAQRANVIGRASGGGTEGAIWATLLTTISTDLRLAQAELYNAESQQQLSTEIEQSKIVAQPSAHKLTTQSQRPAVVVALFVGAALGAVAALLLGWLRGRRS